MMRNEFTKTLAKYAGVETDPLQLKTIENMTAHIWQHQFTEFLEKCYEGRPFKNKIETIKSVSDEYKSKIKSVLFSNVESSAKEMSNKIEAYFRKIESFFSPNHENYHVEYVIEFEIPSKLLEHAVISTKEYWNDQDVYIINKIGLRVLYDVFNDPYRQLEDVIAHEMKNAITVKAFGGDKKSLPWNDEIKKLANEKRSV